MKKKTFSLHLVAFLALLIISHLGFTQNIQWQKTLGGTDLEVGNFIQPTSDGGYILTGYTGSNDGDVSAYHAAHDVWVVKLNVNGTIQWQKALGGSAPEEAYSIQTTLDGGYILAGYTYSSDGDVSQNNFGGANMWVVKLDSNGIILWEKVLDRTFQDDKAYSIQPTSDGGYILAGYTGINVTGNYSKDIWVVKLDVSGVIQWEKTLGGTADEEAYAIQATSDGGYILAGYTASNDGDIIGNHGGEDIWLVKLTSNGTIDWQKTLGGTANEEANSIQSTSDGGYILAGYSASNNGDININHGVDDAWIVKLDANGIIQWQKAMGGTNYDKAYSIQATSDGGYVLTGYSASNDGNVSVNHGYEDVWVVKLASNGIIQWEKTFGGTSGDYAYSIQVSPDGGYILAGYTGSNDGNVSGNHSNSWDIWVVKIDNTGVGVEDKVIVKDLNTFPNPFSNDKFTLNYYLSQSTNTTISVLDVLGNIVRSEKQGVEAVGEHKKELKLDGLASGIYFLQLKTEHESYTTKIVKN